MDRRSFVRLLAAAPLAPALPEALPKLRVVTSYRPAAVPGMPGPYPGRVVAVKSEKSVDTASNAANDAVVREMMSRGLCALTAAKTAPEAWRRFFAPADVVGIKVNCAPHLPEGVTIVAAETANRHADNRGYDPATYVEADLFGEEDTRSNMMRLVTQKLTKIINIPNVKDHGATGATGCLKNVAYGSFSNVARTHYRGKSHTYSFVGTLASVEPLRSRTVLQIMDGLRGVWHGGPFAHSRRYLFHPKQILFGTDPVAIDRLLLDIIDEKRKAEGAISIWGRSPRYLRMADGAVHDLAGIKVQKIEV